MIKFLRHVPRLLYLGYFVARLQILRYHSFSFKVQVIAWFLQIMYPLGYVIKPRGDFGERLTSLCEKLGPIYIKFGQTLSTRPDLVGYDVTESLKYLQDKLPPFDTQIAQTIVSTEFGKGISEIFGRFDEKPVAAASISQVHKARLHGGDEVAVKILRPNISKIYNNDIAFLEYIAHITSSLVAKTRRLKLYEVVKIFKNTMHSELDLRLEAAAISQFAENFTGDDGIRIPKVYWQLTSEKVLVTEWIDGVSIYDREKITEMGLVPSKIAAIIAVTFFNQAYRDGFFHADLHPGNILVCPDGRVALLDFGIMGILLEKDRLAIAEILYGFLKRDYRMVARIHLQAGYIPKNTSIEIFAQHCRAIAEPILGLPVKDMSVGRLLAHLFKITEYFGMETQPQLILLQKTMVVVEGVGRTLDPEINMWQLAEPWIKKWAVKNITPEMKIIRFLKKYLEKIGNDLW